MEPLSTRAEMEVAAGRCSAGLADLRLVAENDEGAAKEASELISSLSASSRPH